MALVNFIDSGKGLYIEGCDYAAQNNTTELFHRFGCLYSGNGSPMDTGNVNTLIGQSGSIVDGLQFGYLYKDMPDNYVDDITAQGGQILFKSQDSLARAVSYSGSSNAYRAIYSAFIFGALRDSPSTKNELIMRYLNYLYDL